MSNYDEAVKEFKKEIMKGKNITRVLHYVRVSYGALDPYSTFVLLEKIKEAGYSGIDLGEFRFFELGFYDW